MTRRLGFLFLDAVLFLDDFFLDTFFLDAFFLDDFFLDAFFLDDFLLPPPLASKDSSSTRLWQFDTSAVHLAQFFLALASVALASVALHTFSFMV